MTAPEGRQLTAPEGRQLTAPEGRQLTAATQDCREGGTSLIEVLVVVAVLGVILVLTAPIERYVYGQLRAAEAAERALGSDDLLRASRMLVRDGQRARRYREIGASVRLELEDGSAVVWAIDDGVLVRRATNQQLEQRERRYHQVWALVVHPNPGNLLEVTLRGQDRSRSVSAHLRNYRRGR